MRTPKHRPSRAIERLKIGHNLLLASAVLIACGQPLAAQIGEQETWFNGSESDADLDPGLNVVSADIDANEKGWSVAVWQGASTGWDIYRRLLDRDGNPIGDPGTGSLQPVNATTDRPQKTPRVAMAADGSHLVVWVNEIETPPDSRGVVTYGVLGRLFGSDGQPDTGEIVIQAYHSFSGGTLAPDVAALAGGGYAVVWRSYDNPNGSDDSSTSIQGRVLDAAGNLTGTQFQVNENASGFQSYPSVDGLPAVDPDGNYDGGFVVAWSGPDTHVRRFRSDGTTNDSAIEAYDSSGADVEVAANEDTGEIGVVWYHSDAIRAHVYDANLISITSGAIQVTEPQDTDGSDPAISDIGPDGFYITWESSRTSWEMRGTTDASADSIQARIVDLDGNLVGGQFQVNTWISNNQNSPAMGSSRGRLSIIWRSAGRTEDDPGSTHMLGYQLDYCLFCDDLESGDTSRWSSTVP